MKEVNKMDKTKSAIKSVLKGICKDYNRLYSMTEDTSQLRKKKFECLSRLEVIFEIAREGGITLKLDYTDDSVFFDVDNIDVY